MRILFLANRIPFPPYRGDKLKIYNLAKELHQRHTLKLVTFYEKPEEQAYRMDLLRFFETVDLVYLGRIKSYFQVAKGLLLNKLPLQVNFFRNREMEEAVANLIYTFRPDVIHVQHLRMAQFIPSHYRNKAILDLPDAISMYYQRVRSFTQNPILKWIYNLEILRLKEYENSVLSKFSKVLCCSQEDLNYLKNIHPFPRYAVLENGVDVELYSPHKHDHFSELAPSNSVKVENKEQIILFTGNMNYAPNVDAVVYFAQEIFPQILSNWPDAIFEIAGQSPVKKVLLLAQQPNIRVTGFLPSLKEAYAKADLVVAPLRFGAGTQNKVLEALSMEIPVVCTPIGFFGLGLKNGGGIWCETESEAFASRIETILIDIENHQKLARIAALDVRKRFNWRTIAKKLETYCTELQNEE